MKARALLSAIIIMTGSAPAIASTIVCEAKDGDPVIEIAVDFAEMLDSAQVTGVRMYGGNFDLSTYPGETEVEPETLAFAEVGFDHIRFGLDAEAAMRIVLNVSIVRAAVYDSMGGPDTDVVVAGVAIIGGERTAILECTGW